MVLSGLLVKIIPDKLDQVKENLRIIEGLKIHSMTDDNEILAMLETSSVEDETSISSDIAKIEGVLEVNLAYHHFNDEGAD
jgi:nitrate reductase NapD